MINVSTLMDIYLQGINMKFLLLKALFCALLSTTLFTYTNFAIAEPTVNEGAKADQNLVSLNKSTIEDLVTLKGIGQKKAQAIVEYREKMGNFKTLNDLTNVKGIGEKILQDNMGRLII
jgi:competence protein ComEA